MPEPKPNSDPGEDQGTPESQSEPQKPESASAQPGDDVAKVRREAAGYRRKLREAEAKIEQRDARISDYERAEVERQITGDGGLQNAADFWLTGIQLDELRDDEGNLDSEKVKAARDRVLAEHPHWRRPSPGFDGGVRQPVREEPEFPFGEALKKAG